MSTCGHCTCRRELTHLVLAVSEGLVEHEVAAGKGLGGLDPTETLDLKLRQPRADENQVCLAPGQCSSDRG